MVQSNAFMCKYMCVCERERDRVLVKELHWLLSAKLLVRDFLFFFFSIFFLLNEHVCFYLRESIRTSTFYFLCELV